MEEDEEKQMTRRYYGGNVFLSKLFLRKKYCWWTSILYKRSRCMLTHTGFDYFCDISLKHCGFQGSLCLCKPATPLLIGVLSKDGGGKQTGFHTQFRLAQARTLLM